MLRRLSTKQLALISLFAALIVITTRLPGIPIALGLIPGKIEFSVPLYAVIGIVLGPWVGALAALIGNFVAWIIPKSTIMGLLLIPAGAFAALSTGFLARNSKLRNWKLAAATFAALLVSWYVTPVGLEAPLYPIFLHLPALLLILIFRGKIFDYLNGQSKRFKTIGVAIASYVGIMADHMWGGLMFISGIQMVVGLKTFRNWLKTVGLAWMKLGFSSKQPIPDWVYNLISDPKLGNYFMLSLPIAAIERVVFTVIAAIIAVAVIRILGAKHFLAFEEKRNVQKPSEK
jgi:uncharacterized membrane protein